MFRLFKKAIPKFLSYLLLMIYPNYVILSFSIDAISKFNKDVLFFFGEFKFIAEHPLRVNAVLILSIFLIPGIIYCFQANFDKKKESNEKTLSALIGIINTIILEKKRRFFSTYKNLLVKETVTSDDIFLNITKPKDQIFIICNNLYAGFINIFPNIDIRLTILCCKDSLFVSCFYYYPGVNPVTTMDEFNAGSASRYALQSKKIFLIPNTTKEKNPKKFFHKENVSPSRIVKSILSYPIIDEDGEVIFVINISSNKENVLLKKYLEKYTLILDAFAERILIEYYLYEMRGMCNEEE